MPELMDKVVDNLWIGSLTAALDAELLHKNGVKSILTAMRGKIAIQKPFARHQILLDDTDEADALVHFPACIDWIDSEIKKGRGVLVHCQAGMSRSATIIAAYLMYARNLDVEAALDLIRKARPTIKPNDGFLAQLAVFHSANYKRTRRNKETRAFYVERAVKEVLNGDGSALEMDMFAKFPRTPGDSVPNTPQPQPRRRLRCKMCRQELASREHMIDHGQVGPATPATSYALSPAVSRRPSAGEAIAHSRGVSVGADQVPVARRSSGGAETVRRPSFGSALVGMTPITTNLSGASSPERQSPTSDTPSRRRSFGSNAFGGLFMTPMTNPSNGGSMDSGTRPRRRSLLCLGDGDPDQSAKGVDATFISAVDSDGEDSEAASQEVKSNIDESVPGVVARGDMPVTTPPLCSPRELAARIHPNLAALRTSPLISALSAGGTAPPKDGAKQRTFSPPLLMPNAKCSGYFVEPMKWMEPILESGAMAGKISCPNKKCGAKLGNFDWAGVECSCKQWVVPGFCIHKSKVDEVVI